MNIGTIVGRFQSPYITEGHKRVIRVAAKHSDEIVFFLLDNKIPFSDRNPLAYDVREKIITSYMMGEFKHKKFRFFSLEEQKYGSTIQREIDNTLISTFGEENKFCMYGGPNSYVGSYSGMAEVHPVELLDHINSHDARQYAYDMEVQTTNLLQGMIHALNYRKTVCHNYIVSVILYDRGESTEIAIVDDPKMKLHTFPTFPISSIHASFEDQARAEITTLIPTSVLGNTAHIKSIKVADWRFRNSRDFCYYHVVLHKFVNRPTLPKGVFTIPRTLNAEEFEDEYTEIVHYLNKVL